MNLPFFHCKNNFLSFKLQSSNNNKDHSPKAKDICSMNRLHSALKKMLADVLPVVRSNHSKLFDWSSRQRSGSHPQVSVGYQVDKGLGQK
jgi:hypothetical protein